MTSMSTRRHITAVLCCALLTGCATTRNGRVAATAPAPEVSDPLVIREYVQRLPPGTAVRVDRASGKSVRGTLMKVTSEVIVVQTRTRIPEPPVEIPISDVLRVTTEASGGSSVGKAIAVGAAAGAGAALGVFLILLAVFAD